MAESKQKNADLIRRVLGDDYLTLELVTLSQEESQETEQCTVSLQINATDNDGFKAEGIGVGLVDAVWDALMKKYSSEYSSLKTIEISKFLIEAKRGTQHRTAGADAIGDVILEIKNTEGRYFKFVDSSRSIVFSGAKAVFAAVEHFINSERAFVMLFKSRDDAKMRNRQDLVTRYTRELSEVVKSTSYSKVIEDMKSKL